ncbi:hypothetical protein [Inquilinus sp. OTU3971]|uniref:hypothetical protein n=1 Tax=Inquilinus sp. OTU3971 TaxID=3043855 RepID=UPI00313D6FAA
MTTPQILMFSLWAMTSAAGAAKAATSAGSIAFPATIASSMLVSVNRHGVPTPIGAASA